MKTKTSTEVLPTLQENTYAVYGLDDPLKEELFYIGLTGDRVDRYTQHLKYNKEEDNPVKYQRISDIKSKGMFPGMHVITYTSTREEGLRQEALAIELFKILKQPLTNQTLTLYTFSEEEKHMLEMTEKWVHTKPHWIHRLRAWLLRKNGYKRDLVIVLRKANLQITITHSAIW